MSISGIIQPSSSGSQRLTTSPVYFTLRCASSSTSFGSSTRVVVKARLLASCPSRSWPRIVWSLIVTSATLSAASSDLNSLYGMARPPGTKR